MALNIEQLAEQIEKEVTKLYKIRDPKNYRKRYYLALSKAIIEHFTANASINGGNIYFNTVQNAKLY